MRAAFMRDLAASAEITLEQWRHRGVGPRTKELLGKMWSYWL
jgi:cardiolipin synthase